MDDKINHSTASIPNESDEIKFFQKQFVYKFLTIFSVPFLIIVALAGFAYYLSTKVTNLELIQNTLLEEVFNQKNTDYTELIKQYEILGDHYSTLKTDIRLASLYFKRNKGNDRNRAFEILNRAKKSYNNSWEIYSTLCAFYASSTPMEEEEAIEAGEKALALHPDDQQSYNNLAWLYAKTEKENLRDLNKALIYANKAVTLTNEKVPENLDTLAEIQFIIGKNAEAIDTIKKAIKILDDLSYYRSKLEKFEKKDVPNGSE